MAKRALQLASVASMIDQFNIPNIRILQSLGYSVDVIADFSDPGTITKDRADGLVKRLSELNVRVFDIPIPRDLSIRKITSAYKATKQIIETEKYDIIHCHSPIGGAICRFAARKIRKNGTRVVYTAHGFHFYKGAPLKNWILFYPVEKICSHWTDALITINKEDYSLASKRMRAVSIYYVPGIGIDTKRFGIKRNGEKIRHELQLGNNYMLLSVGELNENKNHEAIIRALNGRKLTYVVAGKGELSQKLSDLANQLGVDLRLVGYREDVASFYDAADGYAIPSKREGLNVSLMEAMASGLPCIASRIRGNTDLIDEGKGGFLFNPLNQEDIKMAIDSLIELNDQAQAFGQYNSEKIKRFDTESVGEIIRSIYDSIAKKRAND